MILTIRSTLLLWEDLREEGVLFLLTRNLNQDPLKNLFGFWRTSLGNHQNPSAKQTRYCAQHSIFISMNKPPKGANCEDDELTHLLDIFEAITTPSTKTPTIPPSAPLNTTSEFLSNSLNSKSPNFEAPKDFNNAVYFEESEENENTTFNFNNLVQRAEKKVFVNVLFVT